MRLNWYWRGIDVIDVEVHANCLRVEVFSPREDEQGDAPRIEAAGHLAASEIAEPIEPDTSTFGFSRRAW